MAVSLPALNANMRARDILCCNPQRGDALTLQKGKLIWTDNSCCSCSCYGSSSGENESNKSVWAVLEAALIIEHGLDATRNALKANKVDSDKARRRSITAELYGDLIRRVDADPVSRKNASKGESSLVIPSTPSGASVVSVHGSNPATPASTNGPVMDFTGAPPKLKPIAESEEEGEPSAPSAVAAAAPASTNGVNGHAHGHKLKLSMKPEAGSAAAPTSANGANGHALGQPHKLKPVAEVEVEGAAPNTV
jgi:hypothetical protein